MKKLQGCMGHRVHTGLPLALGKHPRKGGVNPPFAIAILFFLPVLIKHLMKKLMGVGLVPHPVSISLCLIPSSTSESMRTCFTEGGSV